MEIIKVRSISILIEKIRELSDGKGASKWLGSFPVGRGLLTQSKKIY